MELYLENFAMNPNTFCSRLPVMCAGEDLKQGPRGSQPSYPPVVFYSVLAHFFP